MIRVVSRRKCLLLIVLAVALGAGTRPAADYVAAKTMDPMEPVSKAAQYRTAAHEAGHAVVARALKKKLNGIHVIAEHPQSSKGLGLTNFEWTDGLATSTEIFDLVAALMGGMASEAIIAGDVSIGTGDDLARASMALAQACGLKGMCGSLIVRNGGPILEGMVNARLLVGYHRASTIIRANADVVRELVRAVMAQPVVNGQRTLDAQALEKFFAEHPVIPEPPEKRQIAPIVNSVEE